MKMLVIGGAGMAGHIISIYFKEKGHDVTALTRRKIDFCKDIIADSRDFSTIKDIIDEGNYDVVINAIGILNSEAENNKANAVLLNSYLPHYLSDITKNTKTKIIHMSTDCVFLGDKGNYSENSLRDGNTFYDRSKALGEIDNKKDLTFRNSIIGPDIKEKGIGLFNWFMKQDKEIKGYTKAIWTGVTTLTLAKAMEEALNQGIVGLYNLVNNDKISKYELLRLFNKYMKDSKIKIEPSDRLIVDKSLINTRKDFDFEVPKYEIMVKEMKDWIYDHKDLYPHYFK